MDELASMAINAHGGLERWRQFTVVHAHQLVSGVLCHERSQGGLANDIGVTVALHHQWASHAPFAGAGMRSTVESNRVAIESLSGQLMAERRNPRQSFTGKIRKSGWDTLQMAYFLGYAMWTSLTMPFNFAMPGVDAVEIEPWDEYGEYWRRLRVRFPVRFATHCREQVFYFDATGLLQRHDYNIDIAGSMPVAHYVAEHREVSGIVIPTSRLVLNRLPDNTALPEPGIVAIEFDDIKFM